MDEVQNPKSLNTEDLIQHMAKLEQQVADFKQSEAALRQAYAQLETQVHERTADLEQLNQKLAQEVVERIQAEKSLLEERRLLHILMDNIPDLIYFKDIASRFTRINRAHARMLGVNDPNDVLGKSDDDFQAPQLAQSFRAEEDSIITFGKSVINREEFNPTPDGTPRWFSATKMPIKDADGRVTGIVGISRDITQSKQAENALRTSEEQFRATFKYAAIGIALVGLDGRWLQVNSALCGIIGYSEPELLVKTFQDITHPDDLDSDLNYVSQLLAGQIESYQMEKRYFHKQGHLVWVLLSVSLVRDSQGQPLHFISQIQNITKRKQTEVALAAERNLLRTLIDSSPDYIFIKDSEGRFILSNVAHAQAAGLNADELVGKTAFEVFPPDLAAQFQEDDECVKQSGESLINMERTTLDQYGKSKTVLTTKIPLRDKEGQVTSLVGISRDITARKQLEAQVLELASERDRVKVLQRFIHDMSHDFRTPLSVISSSLYLLQKYTDPQKQEVYAKRAEQQILRVDKLLEELLQMEHLDQGETTFQFSLMEINAFLAPIIREYKPIVSSKQITVEFISDSDSCFARIDEVEFARVMTKLMDNAVAYTPEGGNITIRTGTEGNRAIVSVQDTGIGIATSDLTHIFERFYRADQARSTETGGSGLGLSIVQKIIEAHNGSIEIESTVGQGSTFSIKLPIS